MGKGTFYKIGVIILILIIPSVISDNFDITPISCFDRYKVKVYSDYPAAVKNCNNVNGTWLCDCSTTIVTLMMDPIDTDVRIKGQYIILDNKLDVGYTFEEADLRGYVRSFEFNINPKDLVEPSLPPEPKEEIRLNMKIILAILISLLTVVGLVGGLVYFFIKRLNVSDDEIEDIYKEIRYK